VNRKHDFETIRRSLSTNIRLSSESTILVEGDSLALLKNFPDHCISLILTDPPYHATKKENIFGDTAFEADAHYVEWMNQFASEWHRVLRPNGSVYCFCASSMVSQLEIMFSRQYNILAHIAWTKPNEPGFDGWKQKMKKTALRQWYAHSERILFLEPAYEGNLFKTFYGNYLLEMRKKAGISAKELAEITGAYGKVNHGGAISNWEAGRNVPSPEQYEKLKDALLKTGKIKSMLPYEDIIRPFNIDEKKEFTDIWNFSSVRPYKGKHPAEKPLDMLEHIIMASSNPGDVVLDCFSGSGSTGVAAQKMKRHSILIEVDPKWVDQSEKTLSAAMKDKKVFQKNFENPIKKLGKKSAQQPLFLD
jgi:adenine-specific DNA-methyltransferase